MLRMNAPEMEGQGGKTDFRRGRCTGDGGSGRENRLQASLARALHRRWRVRAGKQTSGEGDAPEMEGQGRKTDFRRGRRT
jgi:hypothetical protein